MSNNELEVVTTLEKYIAEEDGQYCVRSHQTGKNFGCYDTREEAEARLDQIQRFKEEGRYLKFAGMDLERQIVYGIVLQPGVIDKQGDKISADEIEKAAHKYALTPMVIGKGHKEQIKAKPVETYIAPIDFELGGQEVLKGSWVMAVKVMDTELWTMVKEGEFTGFSIGAYGRKRKVDEVEEDE
jgi:DNA adenine methylase